MNKVIFCHDGPIEIDEYGNLYSQTYNEDFFSRYRVIADKIIIVNRVKKVKYDINRISKTKDNSFEIIKSPNFSEVKNYLEKKNKLIKTFENLVDKNDYFITRLPSQIGQIGYDFASKHKIPCLVELVGDPWDAYWNHSYKGKIIAPIAYVKTKYIVKNSGHVVYVTKNFLQKRYPTNGKSINASNVSLTEFDRNTLISRKNKINNYKKSQKIVIGTTASVEVRYKGQEYVIKAINHLKQNGYTNFEYQLVGGGDNTYLKKVVEKEGIQDQVKFLGSLSHEKVFEWLQNIDIYAQPSKQEGLPRAVIEAMSKALPTFGSNVAGIPELLEDKFIFRHGKNSYKDISTILLSFDENTMLEQANRNYIESQKYDREVINKRRRDFFKEFKNDASKY